MAEDLSKTLSSDSFVLNWDKLLSPKRERASRGMSLDDHRSPFEKDYQRIVLSASFRRLQDKTQVFPLDQSDFVRTRLSHSLEVSAFSRSLGQRVCHLLTSQEHPAAPSKSEATNITDVLLSAGLLHDIGNPPFGHYGETTIRDFFRRKLPELNFFGRPLNQVLTSRMIADFLHFEGNAQALRLMSRLHFIVDEHGMNLTYAILGSILKYPVSSLEIDPHSNDIRKKKMGYFLAEEALFQEITETLGLALPAVAGRPQALRHPLTFLLEAADDLAYHTADIEDAYRKDRITYPRLLEDLHREPRIEHYNEEIQQQYRTHLRRLSEFYDQAKDAKLPEPELYAIQNFLIATQTLLIRDLSQAFVKHYNAIMNGLHTTPLAEDRLSGLVLDVLESLAYRYVFHSKGIIKLEVGADAILAGLLDRFVPACIYYDTERALSPVEHRLMVLISDNYKHSYHSYAKGKSQEYRLYLRLLLVADFICGMTDSYARDLHHKIYGH